MAVNELDRDYLSMVHNCDTIHNIINNRKMVDATDEEKKLSLYKAFHDNCKGCHKEQQKGPVKCIECHPKLPKK